MYFDLYPFITEWKWQETPQMEVDTLRSGLVYEKEVQGKGKPI